MKAKLVAAGFFLAAAAAAEAQDIAAGRLVAARICQSCHGLNGIAKQPDAANLAAQDAGYLSRQITAFRDGGRTNEQMSLVAKMLTDEQIANVSAFYGAIEITVRSVPGGAP